MTELKDEEFQKVAEVTGVSAFDLQKLYSMGMFRESMLLDTLIRYDFKKLKAMDKYRTTHIIMRLMDKYHVSRDKVATAVSFKNKRYLYCQKCGKRIGKAMFVRNDGICDNCVAKSIEI